MIEIVPFTGPLSDSGDDGESTVLRGDVVDQLLHDDGFSDSGSSEEAYLPSFEHRADEIDDLDSRFEDFCLCRELLEFRRFPVDGPGGFRGRSLLLVDRISQDVEHPSQHAFSDRHGDRLLGRSDLQPPFDSFDRIHCDGPNDIVSQLLLDFEHELVGSSDHFKGIVDIRDVALREFDIDDDADDLRNDSSMHRLVGKELVIYIPIRRLAFLASAALASAAFRRFLDLQEFDFSAARAFLLLAAGFLAVGAARAFPYGHTMNGKDINPFSG